MIGSGPIGLMFARLAREARCVVSVAGRGQTRLEAASRLGGGPTFDVGPAGDVLQAVRAQTKEPFDVVFEAVGKPEAWEVATRLVRKGGVVNFFGGCPAGTTVNLDTTLVHYSNLTLLASFHHTPATIRQALNLIEAGIIRAVDFVDGTCPLTQLPELLLAMARGNRAVKTLIEVER